MLIQNVFFQISKHIKIFKFKLIDVIGVIKVYWVIKKYLCAMYNSPWYVFYIKFKILCR